MTTSLCGSGGRSGVPVRAHWLAAWWQGKEGHRGEPPPLRTAGTTRIRPRRRPGATPHLTGRPPICCPSACSFTRKRRGCCAACWSDRAVWIADTASIAVAAGGGCVCPRPFFLWKARCHPLSCRVNTRATHGLSTRLIHTPGPHREDVGAAYTRGSGAPKCRRTRSRLRA